VAKRLTHHLELIPQALRAVRCFDDWPAEVLARMTAAAELWHYEKGQVVAERGDPPKGLWIIASGSLTSHRTAPNGKYYLHGVLWPGYMIGLMPVLDDWPMPWSHAARRDSHVAFVPRAALVEALNDARCLRDISTLLCQRSRVDGETIFTRTAESLNCRLAKTLAYLPRRSLIPIDDPGDPSWADPSPIDLTQEELAATLGVARQTLNRALQLFLQEGIVVRDGDAIRVVNFRKLLAYMEENEPLYQDWRAEIVTWDERLRRSDPSIAALEARMQGARP